MNQYSYKRNSFLDDAVHVKPGNTGGGRGPGRPPKKRGIPVGLTIVIDVLLAALLLGIFYVTNFMIKKEVQPTTLPTPSAVAATSASTPAATDNESSAASTGTTEATTAAIDPNDWRAKFAGKFTDGEPVITENSYVSANINVTIDIQTIDSVRYYVADIYVADLKYFRTAFAGANPDVMGDRALTDEIAQQNGAIIAIAGDHCVDNQDTGVVIRNGNSYADNKPSSDQFAMFIDGTMKAYSPEDFNYDEVVAAGIYQVWSFGPMLLQNGQPMTEFNMPDQIGGVNPRAVVGYFEPGHYCFVVVGGRQEGYAEGCTLEQLSRFMYDNLKCAEAYNLDGGRSAEIIFMGQMLNEQASGRRSAYDILYVGEKED